MTFCRRCWNIAERANTDPTDDVEGILLIDLASFNLKGRCSLFAAHRLAMPAPIPHITEDVMRACLAMVVVSLVLLGGLRIWARDSLTRTRINRLVISTIAIALVGQAVTHGAWAH